MVESMKYTVCWPRIGGNKQVTLFTQLALFKQNTASTDYHAVVSEVCVRVQPIMTTASTRETEFEITKPCRTAKKTKN